MVLAKICPLNGQSVRKIAENSGLSKTRVAQARVVLQYAPSMSDMVLNGELPLNDAYRSAQEAKQTEQAGSEREEAGAAKLISQRDRHASTKSQIDQMMYVPLKLSTATTSLALGSGVNSTNSVSSTATTANAIQK